jgi:hypothetical protein
MAKIIYSESGPVPPGPDDPARPIVEHKEVVVTPNPRTRTQRQGNTKAERAAAGVRRQEENAHRPAKLSKGQKKARRKRERDRRYKTVQADLTAGRITSEEAKNRLPRRQQSCKTAS